MKFLSVALASCLSAALVGCNTDVSFSPRGFAKHYDFSQSDFGFTPMIADYPVGEETFYELDVSYGNLPEPFATEKGWKISGNNHSDDLLATVVAPVTGLEPMRTYSASIEVEIITDVPSNCFGIGGSPGFSVYVKAAVSDQEPSRSVDNLNHYRINLDIGNQSNSGTEGQSIGNVENSLDCGQPQAWEKKVLTTQTAIDVTSDNNGQVWILAGFDSGFEGKTTIYLSNLSISFAL